MRISIEPPRHATHAIRTIDRPRAFQHDVELREARYE
jgi:hypothetical protein